MSQSWVITFYFVLTISSESQDDDSTTADETLNNVNSNSAECGDSGESTPEENNNSNVHASSNSLNEVQLRPSHPDLSRKHISVFSCPGEITMDTIPAEAENNLNDRRHSFDALDDRPRYFKFSLLENYNDLIINMPCLNTSLYII